MTEIDPATAMQLQRSRLRFAFAMSRLLRALEPFMRAEPRHGDAEMPEHLMVWVTDFDGGPVRVILDAMKTAPQLWMQTLPAECCIVPRKALERCMGPLTVEFLAAEGSRIVEDHAARALYEAEEESRSNEG